MLILLNNIKYMPSTSSSPATIVTTYITHLRAMIALLQDESLATDASVLDILLSLERMLDHGRALHATYVSIEDRVHQTSELHAELDSLRSVIANRLQSLPPTEAKALLQSRLSEAGSSWWHLVNTDN
jgi:hypothetical protein